MSELAKYLVDDEDENKIDSLVLKDTNNESILAVLNTYLMTPRFDGDSCIVLTMPEATIKKYSEKLNAGLWWMYNKFCRKDFGMMQLLVAVETMVDAAKLATFLDMDIKLLVAKEHGISVTENDIENAALKTEEEAESSEPIKLSQEYLDKLTEDDPEEEAFILAGLED